MEEGLNDALLDVGELLAEALHAGLSAGGLTTDLMVRGGEGRVSVVSRSADVWRAETGSAGLAPSAPLAGVVRSRAGDVVARLRDRLAEVLR